MEQFYNKTRKVVSVFKATHSIMEGDTVAYWTVGWTPDCVVNIQAPARALCCVLGQDSLKGATKLYFEPLPGWPKLRLKCWET